ncbi:aquaporin Z [Rhizobium tibeticum]|uniref:Aquaporin Z n=1 Tax=Rhizobium tibeticum TaxID=501024 RepID=A0A1H8SN47_9HYPH|nr:Aquaporin Z 2 [Rhizobium tibeticum]SEO80005.1 aquaporin Z [Rhizobium tibeticum]
MLAAAFPELGIGFVSVAFAFGLTVLTMAFAVGGISGGHFNPAVSVGLAVAGKFPAGRVVPYIAVQVIGARNVLKEPARHAAAGLLRSVPSCQRRFPR